MTTTFPDGFLESRKSLKKLAKGLQNSLLATGGLAIKAGGSTLAKLGTATRAIVDGGLITIGANTDCAALSGTVANGTFNVFVFSVKADGTQVTRMGTAGATIGAVRFPMLEEDEAMEGFVIINPTGTGDFVGGTTPLDDATVTPGAVYVNTPHTPNLGLYIRD